MAGPEAERRVERAGLAAMALGVLLWAVAPAFMDLGYDASAYAATGHGWARTGELVLAWGDVLTWGPEPEGHSHHFPPAYPLLLGVVFKAFGYGLAQAKLAAVGVSLAALAVAYATTRDLYGRTAAAVVAGALALDPHLLWVTGMGFSEGLSLMLFTLTMWCILRSLDDERWIVLGGLFAGLAYLARASMGAFFLLAGLAGVAWRLRHRGPRALASPWYALAVATFGLVVAAWAWRNVALYGWPHWETSPGSRAIPAWIADHPVLFAASMVARGPVLFAVFLPFVALLAPEVRRSVARVRDERVSGLWLATGLAFVLGVVFSATYLSMGPTVKEIVRLDNMRYVLVGVVPLLWLAVREADWRNAGTRRRWLALGLVLLALCGAVFAYPAQYLPAQAARALDPHLMPGDAIVVHGAGKYPFYASLTDPTGVEVWVDGHGPEDARPEFHLTLRPKTFDGYVLLAEKTMDHRLWIAPADYVAVWGRADVVENRSITLEPLRAGW